MQFDQLNDARIHGPRGRSRRGRSSQMPRVSMPRLRPLLSIHFTAGCANSVTRGQKLAIERRDGIRNRIGFPRWRPKWFGLKVALIVACALDL
jgi:hypothetical protein